MKTMLLAFIFQLSLIASAQNLDVEPIKRNISKGEAEGYMIFMQHAKKKDIEKKWRNYVFQSAKRTSKRDSIRPEYKLIKDEYFAKNFTINQIHSDPITIIANITSTSNGVRLSAFFEIDNKFVGSQSKDDHQLSATAFMREFALDREKERQSGVVLNEQKNLKALEKQNRRLQRDRDKQEKSIARNKVDIINKQSQQRTNQNDQEITNKRILELKQTLNSLEKQSDGYAEFEKRLKSEEKKLKSLFSQAQKLQRDIVRNQQSIRKSEEVISENLSRQKEIQLKIDQQNALLQEEQNKLLQIK